MKNIVVHLNLLPRACRKIECTTNVQDQCDQESGPFNLGQGECTTNIQDQCDQQSRLFNLGQGECTTNVQDQCDQESGPFDLGQGEHTTNVQDQCEQESGPFNPGQGDCTANLQDQQEEQEQEGGAGGAGGDANQGKSRTSHQGVRQNCSSRPLGIANSQQPRTLCISARDKTVSHARCLRRPRKNRFSRAGRCVRRP